MLSPFWYDLNFHPCLLLILKCGIVINQCVGIGEQNELTYSISDMHRDLILTVTNALVYNKKGSDVYNMALKLRAHITKLFEVILDSALQVIIVS
jgi:hypothetical protein